MYEVEQKFKLTDPTAFLAKTAELGADWTISVEEIDTYFQHPCRDFAATDEAFRIRRHVKTGERTVFESFITYKGARLAVETKTRRELELPLHFVAPETGEIDSLAALVLATRPWEDLLTALGFRPVHSVRKHRRKAWLTWNAQRVEISHDDVPPTGQWAEIEVVVSEPARLAQAEETILTLAERLGLSHPEKRSYLELVMRAEAGLTQYRTP